MFAGHTPGGCYAIRYGDDGAGVDFAFGDCGAGVAMMTWHDRAKARMQELGITQTALGDRLRCEPNTVASWFYRDSTPRDHQVLADMAEILGVSVEWLMTGEKITMPDFRWHTHTPEHSIRHALLLVDGVFLPGRYSAVNHVWEAWDGAGYYVVWPESWCDLAE